MAQPPTSLEALLAEAPFLRALARSLVHGDAEDLVQETWLRALSSPPRHTRSLRGWLATVAFNLLRTSGRQNQRRAAAEAAAAPMPAAPSPVEILAYQEQLAKVAQAVRELPEPCRLVLHLRYHEECAPPEIARRLGEPLDTVKSRLKRALQLLRERLDKEHGGVRSAWRLALAPFLETPKAAAPALLGPALAGGAIMGIKVKGLLLVGAALLLGLVFWTVLGGPGPRGAGTGPGGGGVPVALEAGEAPPSSPPQGEESPPEPARREAPQKTDPPSPPSPGWTVRGRVVERDSGAPVAGAEVRGVGPDMVPLHKYLEEQPRSATTDGLGRFVLGGLEKTVRRVAALHPDFAEGVADVDPGAETGIEVRVGAGYRCHGRVLDDLGDPAPGVAVALWSIRKACPRLAVAGPGGVYRTPPVEAGWWILRADPPEGPRAGLEFTSEWKRVRLVDRDEEVDFGPGPGQVSWKGTLFGADGKPLPGVDIAIHELSPPSMDVMIIRGTATGAEGRFHFRKLPPASWIVRAGLAGLVGSLSLGRVALEDPGEVERDLALPRTIIHGTVFRADGVPLSGAGFVAAVAPGQSFAVCKANLRPDGGFLFQGIPPGRYALQASVPCFFTRSEVECELIEGRPLEGIRLEIAPAGELRLELSGFEKLEAQLHDWTLRHLRGGRTARARGLLRRGRPSTATEALWLEPGLWAIQASLPGIGELSREAEVVAGESRTVRIDRSEFEETGGSVSIAGELLRSDQTPLAGASITLMPHGLFPSHGGPSKKTGKTDGQGRFSVAGLGPGLWRVTVNLGAGIEAALPDVEIPKGASTPFPVRWLLPSGKLRARLVDGTRGGAFTSQGPSYWVHLHREHQKQILLTLESRPWGPEFELSGIAGGRYYLRISVPGFAERATEVFQLEEGADLDLGEIRLEAAGLLELIVRDAQGRPFRGPVLLFPKAGGLPFPGREMAEPGRFLFDRLAPGPGTWIVSGSGIQNREFAVELKPGETVVHRL